MPEPTSAAVRHLRRASTIRERCERILGKGKEGELSHFRVDMTRMPELASYVVAVTREQYPDLRIPVHSRWRHFDVGGVERTAELSARLADLSPEDRARAKLDLAVTSVLLDAGAGPGWRYRESESGKTFDRSEGLAVASYRMFLDGAFSSDPKSPLRADAAGLLAFDEGKLRRGFQVTDENPLAGAGGRAALLRDVGKALRADPRLFGEGTPRPGNLVTALGGKGQVEAADVLTAVLDGLSSIFPGRLTLDGEPLGDVWPHSALDGKTPADGLVPFHKLSQWLTYSLFEPLAEAGIEVVAVNELTGLAEYRNGGLFVDGGVLTPIDPEATRRAHPPSSELVVEWRALTVALLDQLAIPVRELLHKTATDFPLANMLEGGTWAAGRKLASQKRPGGAPPLTIESDGTVF